MSELVFDVGMHNGDDTAYYLSRGYRVVAVEANPVLCAEAGTRFAAELAEGRLTIRNVGIAAEEGELDFWVSSRTEWSSFHADNATKGGALATSTRVRTVPFARLLEEEGTPWFVKIDIERNDSLCLQGLVTTGVRPAYLSIESHRRAYEDLALLDSLGYRSFKCVRQNDLKELTPGNVVYQQEVRRGLAALGRGPKPARAVRAAVRRVHYRRPAVGGWTFPLGSSGPLAADLPGDWLSTDEVLAVWHQLFAYNLRLGVGGVDEWYDLHARYDGPSV